MKYVVDLVREKFKLEVEYELSANLLLLRIRGIDNVSLAKEIRESFKHLKVTTKEIEGYKFSDTEWIKIEKK